MYRTQVQNTTGFMTTMGYKNLLADHTQGGKDNSFKQQPLVGVLSQAEIGKEGGVRVGLQGPQVVVSRHLIVATASAAPSSH
eukprot:COSAG06_NODE_938_length_11391_cov_13.363974_2_plen_82_part_00